MSFASFLRMSRSARVFAAAAAACACCTASAAAQGDGVFVDPDSPAAKEYELPLEQARQDAVTGGDRTQANRGSAPLFGEGVTPAAKKPARRETSRDSTSRGSQQGTKGAGAERLALPNADLRADEDGSGALALLAGGAGVLLLAGLGGFALRRRSSPA